MRTVLNRTQIDDAIALAKQRLTRFQNNPGRYPNTFNSHVLGYLGEIALDTLFTSEGHPVIAHYRDLNSLGLCDVEVGGSVPYRRLELKTWASANWADLGRCIQVGQLKKIQDTADAIVWCTVPLSYLRSEADLARYRGITVDCVGFSLPADVLQSPVKFTGRENARKVENYQVPANVLREPSGLMLIKNTGKISA